MCSYAFFYLTYKILPPPLAVAVRFHLNTPRKHWSFCRVFFGDRSSWVLVPVPFLAAGAQQYLQGMLRAAGYSQNCGFSSHPAHLASAWAANATTLCPLAQDSTTSASISAAFVTCSYSGRTSL